ARVMAQEAIVDHIELLKEMGKPLSEPTSLEEIMEDHKNTEAVAFLVTVPSEKAVRVNITLPEDVLTIIDKRARDHHMTRSSFLAAAALKYEKNNVFPNH
ncbi:MAG: type II toxin-antitoxin system HicB family antitoxin, partial [Alphaproteobacteria bacterium]|nr:type II toxin-antitoxin system HicB family antitoxin [Alphaproteobacteria bacterium]